MVLTLSACISGEDDFHTISVKDYGDFTVYRTKCSDNQKRDDKNEYKLVLFGEDYDIREKFYTRALLQSRRLDINLVMKSDLGTNAFVNSFRDENGLKNFNNLYKFASYLEGEASIFAPILFESGINTVYQLSDYQNLFFIESIKNNGDRITKYFGKINNDEKGYFIATFVPAVDCNFITYTKQSQF